MQSGDLPSYSRSYAYGDLPLQGAASYVFRESAEARSSLDPDWREIAKRQGVEFHPIEFEEIGLFRVAGTEYSTRSKTDLTGFIRSLSEPVYLDITGLDHATWAPILRVLISSSISHRVIYTEPATYRKRDSPSEGLMYDLSERTRGIEPIPQFARLSPPDRSDVAVIALVGFEGPRLSRILQELEIDDSTVNPVVGMPGFRWYHPFEAVEGNMAALPADVMAEKLRFARADSPFEVFAIIDHVASLNIGKSVMIAPVGTKPHGVGAVLYALANPMRTHLVYDHPIRAAKRSTGFGRTHEYLTDEFVKTSLFAGRR